MKPHPYLRAYMAGITVPTIFLIGGITVYAIMRTSLQAPVERVIMFPMAVVPNLWGAWNMLHLALRSKVRVSLGVFGAVLPLLLVPAGVTLASALGVFTIRWALAFSAAPVGMAIYYLVWKYVVGFLNEELGIA